MNSVLLSVAGSDSCSGAGIQRDTQVCHDLGVHPLNVITAITAQNAHKVFSIEAVSDEMFKSQLTALRYDFNITVVKSGMIATINQVKELSKFLDKRKDIIYICDPVMISTSGYSLMENNVIDAIKKQLLPRADIFTPNLYEAQYLLKLSLSEDVSDPDMISMSYELMNVYGIKGVLLKGGHNIKGSYAVDYFCSISNKFWLKSDRYLNKFNTHGSGCALASAIGSFLVKGHDTNNSIVLAKAYVGQAIKMAQKISVKGSYFLKSTGFPANKETFPEAYFGIGDTNLNFKKIKNIGMYPIVDSSQWVLRLAKEGVKTIQLRIKDKPSNHIEDEIIKSIQYQHEYGLNLFINDHYKLAIHHGAFGVHLGHEDVMNIYNNDRNCFAEMSNKNMAIGLSTHDYYELSIATSISPSYIALGPIFPTDTKKMKFKPQGINRISEWKSLTNIPIVAIGGIKENHIPEIMKTGADGIAFVTLITLSKDPKSTINNIVKLMSKGTG